MALTDGLFGASFLGINYVYFFFMDEPKLTIRELAAREHCHPNTVRRWIEQGYFPHAYRMSKGGGWKIPMSDYEQRVSNFVKQW